MSDAETFHKGLQLPQRQIHVSRYSVDRLLLFLLLLFLLLLLLLLMMMMIMILLAAPTRASF